MRGDPRYPRSCEFVRGDRDDPTDCAEYEESIRWPKKRRCNPCFWLTFPEESWALHRLWSMCREEFPDGESGTSYGFNDARWQSLIAAEHPALDVFERWETYETLLEMSGFMNAPYPIEQSEWLAKT